MPVPSRHAQATDIIAGQRTFFVTSSIASKRSLLQSRRSAGLFITVLYDYRSQGKYLLHEFVVMPNHFHLLLTVGEDLAIERALQLIKGGFAYRAGREFGFRPPVWQKGFSESRIRDTNSFRMRREYIRENPVRRRLAARAEEFPFCSFYPGFELDPPPHYLSG